MEERSFCSWWMVGLCIQACTVALGEVACYASCVYCHSILAAWWHCEMILRARWGWWRLETKLMMSCLCKRLECCEVDFESVNMLSFVICIKPNPLYYVQLIVPVTQLYLLQVRNILMFVYVVRLDISIDYVLCSDPYLWLTVFWERCVSVVYICVETYLLALYTVSSVTALLGREH